MKKKGKDNNKTETWDEMMERWEEEDEKERMCYFITIVSLIILIFVVYGVFTWLASKPMFDDMDDYMHGTGVYEGLDINCSCTPTPNSDY